MGVFFIWQFFLCASSRSIRYLYINNEKSSESILLSPREFFLTSLISQFDISDHPTLSNGTSVRSKKWKKGM